MLVDHENAPAHGIVTRFAGAVAAVYSTRRTDLNKQQKIVDGDLAALTVADDSGGGYASGLAAGFIEPELKQKWM